MADRFANMPRRIRQFWIKWHSSPEFAADSANA